MEINRRFFIKTGLLSVLPGSLSAQAESSSKEDPKKKAGKVESLHVGCLVDTTLCIGCRKCEEACNRRNQLPRPDTPFVDRTVFRERRRPTKDAFTVVNQYPGSPSPDQKSAKNTHCKIQCMHCLTPACVSACVVGAMVKLNDGSVVYNKNICLGCRYCMVACPFEVPAYEYAEPLKPRVRKCVFCADYEKNTGADPACAAACPTEALVFGKRKDLLTLARHRIEKRPDRYLDYIYGEKESGGTSWLYLVGRPPTEIGLLKIPGQSPATLTETIQHGIFKYGIIPIAVYGFLGSLMWRNRRKNQKPGAVNGESPGESGKTKKVTAGGEK